MKRALIIIGLLGTLAIGLELGRRFPGAILTRLAAFNGGERDSSRQIADQILLRLSSYELSRKDDDETSVAPPLSATAEHVAPMPVDQTPPVDPEAMAKIRAAQEELQRLVEAERNGRKQAEDQLARLTAERERWERQENVVDDRKRLKEQVSILDERLRVLEPLVEERAKFMRENDELRLSVRSLESKVGTLQAVGDEKVKLSGDYQNSLVRINSLTMENSVLRKNVDDLRIEHSKAAKDTADTAAKREATLKEDLEKRTAELNTTRNDLMQLQQGAKDVQKIRDDLQASERRVREFEGNLATLRTERDTLSRQVTVLTTEAGKRKSEIEKLQAQLDTSYKSVNEVTSRLETSKRLEQKTTECQDQLLKTKNELVLARTELDELERRAQLAPPARRVAVSSALALGTGAPPKVSPPVEPPLKPDVLVVAVIVPKANLRSGPGEEHSSMMEIGYGMRLTVEEKMANWYRVFTPTGSRAYIRSDLVTDQVDSISPNVPPPTALKSEREPPNQAGGATPAEEAEARRAFEILTRGIGGDPR